MIKHFCTLLMAFMLAYSCHCSADYNSKKTRLAPPYESRLYKYNKPTYRYYAYLDTSYNYLVRDNIFTSTTYNRLFDIEENGLTLQQFGVFIEQAPPEGLGARLRILAGRDANRVAPAGWNPYYGSQTLAMYPYEGYLQYQWNRFTFYGGALDTLAGRESNESDEDLNFSRSILAYAQPGTFLGLRSKYNWNDTVILFLGLGNGNSTFLNATQLTLIEAAFRYMPHPDFIVGVHGSNGPVYVVPGSVVGEKSRFSLLDVVASYKPRQDVELALNGDYYTQHKGQTSAGQLSSVSYEGIAVYAAYDYSDKWRLAMRAEIFDDVDGYTFGVSQTWREATLTLQYMPRSDIILRAETRRDFSNVNSFVNSSGIGSTNNQQSFAIEGIYRFI